MLIENDTTRLLGRFPETRPLPARAADTLAQDLRFLTEIRSAQQAKDAATALRTVMETHGIPITRGGALNLISQMHGHRDWNAARPVFEGHKITGPCMTVICGNAGTGKTTLMRMMMLDAEDRGLPVITVSGWSELRGELDLAVKAWDQPDRPSLVDTLAKAVKSAKRGTTIFVNESTAEAVASVDMDALRARDLHIVWDGLWDQVSDQVRLVCLRTSGLRADPQRYTGAFSQIAHLMGAVSVIPEGMMLIAEPDSNRLTVKMANWVQGRRDLRPGWLHIARPECEARKVDHDAPFEPWDDARTSYLLSDGSIISQDQLDFALTTAREGRKFSGIAPHPGRGGKSSLSREAIERENATVLKDHAASMGAGRKAAGLPLMDTPANSDPKTSSDGYEDRFQIMMRGRLATGKNRSLTSQRGSANRSEDPFSPPTDA